MWFVLKNMLVAYADDATLLVVVPSPDMRSVISDSLNRDLAKISELCKLWGMIVNLNKTQSMIVSRSKTLQPQHPDHIIDNVLLPISDSFEILGVTLIAGSL